MEGMILVRARRDQVSDIKFYLNICIFKELTHAHIILAVGIEIALGSGNKESGSRPKGCQEYIFLYGLVLYTKIVKILK